MKSVEEIKNSGILEEYILGSTDEAINQQVSAYLKAYPELHGYINDLEKTLENVSLENQIPPPASLKQKIISEIGAQHKISTAPAGVSRLYYYAACFVLGFMIATLIVGMIATNFRTEAKLRNNELALLQEECANVQNQYALNQTTLDFITESNTRPIILEGNQLSPSSSVVVYLNEEKEKALLNILNLPALEDDKTYQMWADVEGEMLDMGVFINEQQSYVDLKFIQNAESLNITIEPSGGSKKPTISGLIASSGV